MSSKKSGRKFEVELDYTYISKASIRRWILVFLGAVVLVVAAAAWLSHQESPESRAAAEIAKAQDLVEQARNTPQAQKHPEELEVASRKLGEAHAARDARRPQEAINLAVEVQRIANQVRVSVQESDAQIFDAGGKVEIQRASRDRWEPARIGQRLYEGDFVKTGPNGTADIVSSGGTLFRVKPDSLFEVQRTVQVTGGGPGEGTKKNEVKLVYGVIDTSTGERGHSTVKTEQGTADISSKSSVGVDVDAQRNTGTSVYRGSATIQTQAGQKVTLGDRERITTTREGLGVKVQLPESPDPIAPENNVLFDMKRHEPVTLRWSKVGNAAKYRLQIAQSRLFIPDAIIVDLADRQGTQAMMTVNDEGSYFWRVAALTKDNLASDWSEVRRFKVLSETEANADAAPPDLSLERPRVIANLVILSGKTAPGASVSVNGEPADVDSSGAFRKTLSLNTEGFNTIIVKATNGAGKETVRKENVVIQF